MTCNKNIFGVVCFGLLLPFFLWSDPNPTPIKLSIEVKNNKVVGGEPIILLIKLINITKKSMKVSYSYPKDLTIHWGEDNKFKDNLLNSIQMIPSFTRSVELIPGGTKNEYFIALGRFVGDRDDLQALYQNEKYNFHFKKIYEKIGNYKIKAELELKQEKSRRKLKLLSNECGINVKDGGNKENSFEWFTSNLSTKELYFFTGILNVLYGHEQALNQFDRFREQYNISKIITLFEKSLGSSSDAMEYIKKNIIIKFIYHNFLEYCEVNRIWGREVRNNTWYKKFKNLNYNFNQEYIPLFKRERTFYAAHINVLVKKLDKAKSMFKELLKGDKNDYINELVLDFINNFNQLEKK